jgi:hypothetical protein
MPRAAHALVAAVLAWAKSEQAAIVRLNVMQPNHRARSVYERCGFRSNGRQSIRDRDGLIRSPDGASRRPTARGKLVRTFSGGLQRRPAEFGFD